MRTVGLPAALVDRVYGAIERLGRGRDGRDEPSSEDLAREGARILARAAARAGERDRRVAFELLAADGLLTLACEAAAGAPDPAGALGTVIEILVEVTG